MIRTQRATIRKPRPAGFTLVELLVVITIIGILIALLLPAVQAAREAARRMQCSNNLKQISLAMHGYHETHTVLPYGSGGCCGKTVLAARGGIWPTMILPYLELNGLYDQIDFNLHVMELPANVVQTVIPVYACPSDSGPSVILNGRFDRHNPEVAMGLWYAGSLGPAEIDPTTGCPHCTAGTHVAPAGSPVNPCCQGSQMGAGKNTPGMFGRGKPGFGFSEITDGLSNTIMVGECLPREEWFVSAFAENQCVLPTHVPINLPLSQVQLIYPFYQRLGFASQHPGGAGFAMGDGSVVFINDSINYLLFNALGTRAGGEVALTP